MIRLLKELELRPSGKSNMRIMLEVTACLLVLTTYLFSSLHWDVDLLIESHFYDAATGSWWINKGNLFLRSIFYYGAKDVIALFGVSLFIWAMCEYRQKTITAQQVRAVGFIVFCLIAVPAVMASLKKLTGVPCPYELDLYSGKLAYGGMLDFHWPDGSKRYACFPAGHPSGGFALLALAHVSPRKKTMTALALGVGFLMGFYQVARGAHFVSHCITTLFLSIVLINILYELFLASGKRQEAHI